MRSSSGDSRRHKDGRAGWIRLDRCTVDERPDDAAGGYPVTIEGVNLRRAISPPRVTIGGQPVRAMRFAPDGRSITGVVDEPPADERLVVDYGFTRAEMGP